MLSFPKYNRKREFQCKNNVKSKLLPSTKHQPTNDNLHSPTRLRAGTEWKRPTRSFISRMLNLAVLITSNAPCSMTNTEEKEQRAISERMQSRAIRVSKEVILDRIVGQLRCPVVGWPRGEAGGDREGTQKPFLGPAPSSRRCSNPPDLSPGLERIVSIRIMYCCLVFRRPTTCCFLNRTIQLIVRNYSVFISYYFMSEGRIG